MRPRQFRPDAPPYAEGDRRAILDDVTRLASQVDHVLVSLHWGEEFVEYPAKSEVRLGHALVEAGARAVLGHHPHVRRPIERVGGSLIAYSLGNFATDMLWREDLRSGVILRMTVDDTGIAKATPIFTHVDRRYRIHPSNERDAQSIVVDSFEGLEQQEYERRVKKALGVHRRAKYRYALRSIHRFPPRMLAQLAFRTIKNKLPLTRKPAPGS